MISIALILGGALLVSFGIAFGVAAAIGRVNRGPDPAPELAGQSPREQWKAGTLACVYVDGRWMTETEAKTDGRDPDGEILPTRAGAILTCAYNEERTKVICGRYRLVGSAREAVENTVRAFQRQKASARAWLKTEEPN